MFIFLLLLTITIIVNVIDSSIFNTAINLGSCSSFAILAGTAVSFNGALTTVSIGSVGVSPGTEFTGNYAILDGAIEDNSAAAVQCVADNLIAYNQASSITCTNILPFSDFAGLTFQPGVYCTQSGFITISASTVTLDALNDTDAVWLFQTETSVSTATATSFILKNGAKASNVYWKVGSSANIAYTSEFVGTILAYVSISFDTNSVINGRALAQAAVTFAGGSFVNSFVGITNSQTLQLTSFIPTAAPTNTPSFISTNNPSNSPTEYPTFLPTTSPSNVTTLAPTNAPTLIPSKNPITIPSLVPSIVPTNAPTQLTSNNNTAIPSLVPSIVPTIAPTTATSSSNSVTIGPSSAPSFLLTSGPTASPSLLPTNSPSNVPTIVPSTTPTYSPSISLVSIGPSSSPSAIASPSLLPTNAPSSSPSTAPTSIPSITPTNVSTFIPTNSPTSSPVTIGPITSTSVTPTISPFNLQTSSPVIIAPSVTPSFTPTTFPTPNEFPTKSPVISLTPSYSPTIEPIISPSFIPTNIPSETTTTSPTLDHVTAPTLDPSQIPTSFPTLASYVQYSYPISQEITSPVNASVFLSNADAMSSLKTVIASVLSNLSPTSVDINSVTDTNTASRRLFNFEFLSTSHGLLCSYTVGFHSNDKSSSYANSLKADVTKTLDDSVNSQEFTSKLHASSSPILSSMSSTVKPTVSDPTVKYHNTKTSSSSNNNRLSEMGIILIVVLICVPVLLGLIVSLYLYNNQKTNIVNKEVHIPDNENQIS